MAIPPCNINYDNIDANIKQSLENNALPNSMTIIPLRTLTINDRKIRIYHLGICENKTKEFEKNNEKLESLINIQNTFKEKYVEKLNKFYGKEETYNLKFIYNFCDAFLCDYTEKREMNDLKNSGIDFEDMKSYCDDLVKLYYRDYQLGDKKREAAKLDVSPIMEEFIHYMKQRIDADINGEDISKKYEDYSRPKMLLVSGHDSTISSLELVLIEAFNKDLEFYEYPEFAAQLAFEVTTDDNNNNRKTYNDYYFNYYLNDNLKLRITVQEFLDKITPHVWNQSYIDKYCEVKNIEEIFIVVNEEKTIINNIFFLFALMVFLCF